MPFTHAARRSWSTEQASPTPLHQSKCSVPLTSCHQHLDDVQVHLGDLPASISGRRLAEGVLKGVGARLAAALALTAGLVGANAVHKLPGSVTSPCCDIGLGCIQSPSLWEVGLSCLRTPPPLPLYLLHSLTFCALFCIVQKRVTVLMRPCPLLPHLLMQCHNHPTRPMHAAATPALTHHHTLSSS